MNTISFSKFLNEGTGKIRQGAERAEKWHTGKWNNVKIQRIEENLA